MKSKPNTNTDRLPPHSPEAEQGLLSCILLAGADVLPMLAERRVSASWFYDMRHSVIYEAAQKLYAANKPVEVISLNQTLKDAGLDEQVGGWPYLNALQDAAPSAANVTYYFDIVKEKWQLRTLLKTCAETAAKVYTNEGDVSGLLASASNDLMMLAEDVAPGGEKHIKEIIVNEVIPELEEHYTRGKTNLPPGNLSSGFDYMDKVGGGFAVEDYITIAGRPGSGKTALAMNIVEHHALKGVPVGVFSLEMSRKSLARRLLFKGARVSMGKFRTGFATQGDIDKLTTASGPLVKAPIYIDSEPAQTIGQIEAKARRMARQYGIKLFVLDYLQLVLPNARNGRIDRVQELTDISAKFVSLKKRLKVPWLILAQMNRNIENAESHRVPVLSDLKDCGAIEQDADQVLFLYFPERGKTRFKNGEETMDERAKEEAMIDDHMSHQEHKEHTERPSRVNIFQAKHREGATGAIEMLFHKNQSRFEDWRQWKTAHGYSDYGKGERAKANPIEEQEEL